MGLRQTQSWNATVGLPFQKAVKGTKLVSIASVEIPLPAMSQGRHEYERRGTIQPLFDSLCQSARLTRCVLPPRALNPSIKASCKETVQMPRKAATKAPVPPSLGEDAAERKRVLNILAQRRYRE